MRTFSIALILLSLFASSCDKSQREYSKFNLNFEVIENGMPRGWTVGIPYNWSVSNNQPDYTVALDSVTVKSGKYSMVIEFTGNTIDDQRITFALPDNYNGKKITLSGYIKTENVTDGFAGIWIQIDPRIAFKDMYPNGISGTTDWKKYELSLDMYPEQTKQILVGGYLRGKGKIWLDDLKVEIDNKDVRQVKSYQPKPFPAEKDKEFDMGSNIEFPELTEQKIDDLELLCRIWGFLKYHHPAIAKGNYNWDYELFRVLPSYLNTNNNHQRDKILINWIEKYGRVSNSKKRMSTSDTAYIKPDNSWIDHYNISTKLKKMLHNIYLNRNQGKHYYIRLTPSVGNPIFTNEMIYKNKENLDAGFRLLTLYRYWNMINYFFPSKYITDKDWNVILKEYIPYFIKAQDRLAYELTTSMLIAEINDTHAFLKGFEKIELEQGNKIIPLKVQFVENKLVVTGYYIKNAQFKIGDVITHINGKSVEAIVDSLKKYYPASNEVSKLRNIAGNILRSNMFSISVDYLSSGVIKHEEVVLDAIEFVSNYLKTNDDTTKCYRFIDKDIGFITLKNIKQEDISVIKTEFMNTKGIIIDIRNYPTIDIRQNLVPYFVSKSTPYAKFTFGNSDNPGEFSFEEEYEITRWESEPIYQGKLIVLVDENTQSHAEFVTMALQAGDNTTVVGSQTAGADGDISELVLPGGLKTFFSGIGVYYPDGRQTQRIGIVPDVVVKPTIKGIREGRDELLEKAIEIIETKN